MKLKILVALIATVLLVSGGAFALTRLLAPAEDEAVAFAPADSIVYANVFIRPSNEQKRSFDAFVRKFPGIESGEDLIQKIVDSLEEDLEDSGLSYEDDIEPWLGDQVAMFVSPAPEGEVPGAAFLFESENDGAAADFVERAADEDGAELEDRSYKGVDYRYDATSGDEVGALVLEGFLVFGTDAGIKAAIDTSQGDTEPLAEAERFVCVTEPLREDWMGLFYLDLGGTVELYLASGEATAEDEEVADLLELQDLPSVASVLYVTPESAVVEVTTDRRGGLGAAAGAAGGDLLPELPGESWAAVGIGGIGDAVSGYLDMAEGIPGFDREQVDALFYGETGLRLDEDVLSWMEDAGLFVQGETLQELQGGLVVESNDPSKAKRAVDAIRDLAAAQGVRPTRESRGGLDGFSVALPGSPAPVNVLGGDRFVIAYGNDATDAAAGDGAALAESESFQAAQDAVGDDFEIGFFVDVDGAQAFTEAFARFAGAPMDDYERDWKPWVDVFTHVVYASKQEAGMTVQKFLIGVE